MNSANPKIEGFGVSIWVAREGGRVGKKDLGFKVGCTALPVGSSAGQLETRNALNPKP